MLIAVLLTSVNTFARDYNVDGINYDIISATELTVKVVSKGEGYSGNIVIPSSITPETYTFDVIRIDNSAFYNCFNLKSVTIPNSVTSIGDHAFSFCDGLTSITIPNSVTTIGNYAFSSCWGLTSIFISNSVTSIAEDAFYGCSKNLDSVEVESGNTQYDSRNDCNAIIETATNTLILGCKNTIIPNGVTKIGNLAFNGCVSLTSITIPYSVTIIGECAFEGCSAIEEMICESATPPTVYNRAFDQLPKTATLYVPVGAREAYARATGWSSFTNIVEDDIKTGVESTLADDVNVSVENGNIIVNGANNAKVEVYSVNGQCIYNGTATTIPVRAKGLYVVKVNDKSFKVIL